MRRQAAWRQASEHQRRRPAGVYGWPQAGQVAVSLRVSLRDGVACWPGAGLVVTAHSCPAGAGRGPGLCP